MTQVLLSRLAAAVAPLTSPPPPETEEQYCRNVDELHKRKCILQHCILATELDKMDADSRQFDSFKFRQTHDEHALKRQEGGSSFHPTTTPVSAAV